MHSSSALVLWTIVISQCATLFNNASLVPFFIGIIIHLSLMIHGVIQKDSVILSIPLELSNWLIEELQPVAILVLFSSYNCPFIMVFPPFFTIGNDFHDFFFGQMP